MGYVMYIDVLLVNEEVTTIAIYMALLLIAITWLSMLPLFTMLEKAGESVVSGTISVSVVVARGLKEYHEPFLKFIKTATVLRLLHIDSIL